MTSPRMGPWGLGLLLALWCGPAVAENWPQWRGPRADGVSREESLPQRWSKTENLLWRLPLPGPAGATPVVWNDRIFLTTVAGNDLVLMCVSTAGQEEWRRVVAPGNRDVRADEGNSASPSPATDGKHVWCFFANGALGCYTVAGEKVWQFNVEERYGQLQIQFGMTSTPVLDGDRLYLQLIHGEGNPATREAKVVCLSALTGAEIWQQGRASDGRDECEHSYASPLLYRDGERAFLITHGADYVVAHDLQTGSELWRCGDLNPKGNYNNTLRFVASPVAVPGMIVVPTAKNGPVVCLKPTGKGDVTEQADQIFWRQEKGTPDVPSPVIHEGLVYLCRENGNLVVVEATTGKQHYEQATVRDRHRASPLVAGGHIYLTARNGTITVAKTGPQFEMVAQNELGEPMTASPVPAAGRLYLRTFEALYAIGAK